MQHGAIFGVVDRRTGEHALNPARQLDGFGQLAQQTQGLGGDEILE